MNTLNKKIFIIGLGRFGQLLAEILKKDFQVYVSSRSNKKQLAKTIGVEWLDVEDGIKTCDTIFYCVPISDFKQIFLSQLDFYKKSKPKLIVDIQSVKISPKKIFEKYLPKHCEALLTHPVFGPDSVKANGLEGLKIMMDRFKTSKINYQFWKQYFESKKLEIVEITAEEHDKQAALSQGVVFFMAKVLDDFGFKRTQVDTFWAEQLHQIVHGAVGNDTQQLFVDLQSKNPYTKKMRIGLKKSLDKISKQLLPKKVNPPLTTYGVQGGRGSFSHQAFLAFSDKKSIKNFDIKYLYTSQKVLKNLDEGNIDYGLIAIENSVGGVVGETVQAMAKFKFKIVEKIDIPIRHFLMKMKETSVSDIKKVMTHPQVIKQCARTLRQKYAHLEIASGRGDFVDHAAVAKALAAGKIDKNIAVIGPKTLAEIYDLEIIDQDLQDDDKNLTSFFIVSR